MIPAVGLLRMLGSGVQLVGDIARSLGGAESIESRGFEDLLSAARDGRIESGAAVRIGGGVDLQLTDGQAERLSAAADRAQAEGVDRALVLLDGMALELDVRERTVVGEARLDSPGVIRGIGSVIRAEPDPHAEPEAEVAGIVADPAAMAPGAGVFTAGPIENRALV
ncbi:MAG: hypothetical protein AAFU70_14805, partial [Planctomycetota bacterium]